MFINRFQKNVVFWRRKHHTFTQKNWLQPLKLTPIMLVVIFIAAIVAIVMNTYVRHDQYQKWEKNEQIFYLEDGSPLFTTTDAPYFLALAQNIKNGKNLNNFKRKRYFSQSRQIALASEKKTDLRSFPLLSVALSLMAPDSSAKSILEAGNHFLLITAFLTTLMIIFSFGVAGYWLEGCIAAAGGGLSLAYLQRSGAGRIDTDQLNLGFFYLMIGLIIVSARVESFRIAMVLAALAGAVFWVFDWWYSKAFFGWIFFGTFIWLSLVTRWDPKRVILQSVLFLSLSGLLFKGHWLGANTDFFYNTLTFDGLVFPNTLDTITEVRKVRFQEILIRTSGSFWVGVFSLVGLGLWGLRHPGLAVVFGPVAAFALLNFIIGNRAIFYSAPILWFGFSWLLITIFRFIGSHFSPSLLEKGAAIGGTTLCFVIVWLSSENNYLQAPSFDRQTVSHFQKLNSVLPKTNTAIVTWWDYGYMSMFMNGRPTLHDGGTQTTLVTHIIANNLISADQNRAAKEFHLLADSGVSGVIANREGKKFKTSVIKTELYLVLTADMVGWMPAISKIGAYDIKANKSIKFDGVKTGYQLSYQNLKCTPTESTQEFICNGNRLNLVSGQLGNNAILDGMVTSKNGRQIGGRNFSKANTPFVLQSEVGAVANRNLLLHRDLYLSVFHQLFYLNRADPKHFELVYDGFPDMRVFKVL